MLLAVRRVQLLGLAWALCAACASAPDAVDPFTPAFRPPSEIRTAHAVLEPLTPEHAERDYRALMSSRVHLQSTLAWGDWPRADFTLEQNRRDLARHWLEFQGHAAYAYAVLSPDRARSLGCVYLEPPDAAADVPGPRLFFWVIEPELATGLDREVLETMLELLSGRRGPLERVVVPILATDERGLEVAESLGLEREGERGGRVLFVHRRPE
jgi:RimJ/RimL family protein N-acetyltransferase